MKKFILLCLAIVFLFVCNTTSGVCQIQKDKLLQVLSNSISFFEGNAYDSTTGAYFSEIDNDGKRLSNRIHLVALSRLIYGLAYSSQYFPENLDKAKKATDFLLNNLVGEDKGIPYFIPSIENGVKENVETLDIWQQAYGLCGITELYRITKDQKLLPHIHRLHDAFIKHFDDEQYPGFFENYSIKDGQITVSKTMQSIMYPITAYMANLWEADVKNRKKYEGIFARHLKLAAEKIWNPTTGWVNVKFDREMVVCPITDGKYCFTVSPGHNFQIALLFLRSRDWHFIDKSRREKYKLLGTEIITRTLAKKEIWDGSVSNGFFSEVNPITNEVLSYKKTWWQTCEAIIALSFVPQFEKEKEQLLSFFISNFVDFEKGNEYFYLNRDNTPIVTEPKGSKGKSSYHTAEMIRFVLK